MHSYNWKGFSILIEWNKVSLRDNMTIKHVNGCYFHHRKGEYSLTIWWKFLSLSLSFTPQFALAYTLFTNLVVKLFYFFPSVLALFLYLLNSALHSKRTSVLLLIIFYPAMDCRVQLQFLTEIMNKTRGVIH